MTSISFQRPPSTKFLEEDYRTIEACKKYILPKIFGDRKFFTAFISGVFACKWMVTLVRKSKLINFSYYCIFAGIISIFYGLF